jgi:hypothetical protein
MTYTPQITWNKVRINLIIIVQESVNTLNYCKLPLHGKRESTLSTAEYN